MPDSLRERIEIFGEGAVAWQSVEEIFRADSWIQVCLGQRLTPRSWHRLGALMSDGRLKQSLEEVRAKIASAVEAMPSHQQFLDAYCPPT